MFLYDTTLLDNSNQIMMSLFMALHTLRWSKKAFLGVFLFAFRG